MRTSLGFLINAPDVLPNDSEKKQIDSGKKRDRKDQRSEALRSAAPELGVDRIERKGKRQHYRCHPYHRCCSQRNNRKREDPIRRKLEEAQGAVLGSSRMTRRAFDGHADLPETNPGAETAEIAMVFRHVPDFIQDPP